MCQSLFCTSFAALHSPKSVMPKQNQIEPSKGRVYEYFSDEGSSYKCFVEKGNGAICGTHITKRIGGDYSIVGFNLKRHIKTQHQSLYDMLNTPVLPRMMESFLQKKSIKVELDKACVQKCCVSMVCLDGLPLWFFGNSGAFQTLFREIAAHVNVPLDRHSVWD